jgi:phosphinothricin acetyltransferase
VGYAYATYWKPRTAYRYTLETSVYIASDHQKKGIGKKIYSHLIEELKTIGFKTLLAGISLPNKGSVLFHENLGFRKVGQLERVGFKFNKWIDVGYWELNL